MDFDNREITSDLIYYGLIAVFVVSLIITVLVLIFSYRSSIKGSFIFYFITNLLIVTTIHSSSYIIKFIKNPKKTNENNFLCSLQSVVLIMACHSQEIIVVIITIICFQAIVHQKIYNFNDSLLFFIICFFIGNIAIPGGIVMLFGFNNALGTYAFYCWINEKKENKIFIFLIFIIKIIAISINTTLSVIMLVIVCRKDNHVQSNKQYFNLCIKTIIFPIIQMTFIISWFTLNKKGKKEIAGFLSSATGVVYPLYIGWYAGIIGKKNREDRSIKKSFSEMAVDSNIIRNSLIIDSNIVNENDKIDSSIDYYE